MQTYVLNGRNLPHHAHIRICGARKTHLLPLAALCARDEKYHATHNAARMAQMCQHTFLPRQAVESGLWSSKNGGELTIKSSKLLRTLEKPWTGVLRCQIFTGPRSRTKLRYDVCRAPSYVCLSLFFSAGHRLCLSSRLCMKTHSKKHCRIMHSV
jgi:hypothetical protein